MVRLLLRFYDPTQGTIRIGKQQESLCDVRTLPLMHLRQQVGLVTQQVQLFHATLRDNLTFWNPTINDAQILAALDTLGLNRWLTTLPAGWTRCSLRAVVVYLPGKHSWSPLPASFARPGAGDPR
ncbi:MAG: ABC transporter ATP-binding protein [Caldilineaceae bacterium]